MLECTGWGGEHLEEVTCNPGPQREVSRHGSGDRGVPSGRREGPVIRVSAGHPKEWKLVAQLEAVLWKPAEEFGFCVPGDWKLSRSRRRGGACPCFWLQLENGIHLMKANA